MLTVLTSPAAVDDGRGGGHSNTVATYTVTFENVTDGQYFTPPNWAGHNRYASIFTRGDTASNGVQQLAENGAVDVLAAELTNNIDNNNLGTSGVGTATGPGEAITFDITTTERRLSIASMIICTNDGFVRLNNRPLPRHDGQTRTYRLRAYDAGTEINTEARGDLVPAPFCGDGPGTGETNPELAENGVIRRHRGIHGNGDLDPNVFDWHGPVVTVTRVG